MNSLLNFLNLKTPEDPTYGRYTLATSPYEQDLLADQELCVVVRHRRVFVEKDGTVGAGEDVNFSQQEVDRAKGRKWVYYQTWTSAKGRGADADACDVVMLHGETPIGFLS